MAKERWKTITGFPKYEVSSHGRVRSWHNWKPGRIMNAATDKKGYLFLSLHGEIKKHCKVHRLVAQAFIKNPKNKLQVNHKNGQKHDNRVCNLEWVTHKENMAHAVSLELYPKGENNPSAKLTKNQVLKIRAKYESGYTNKTQLARQYGVRWTCVHNIITRQSWSHI